MLISYLKNQSRLNGNARLAICIADTWYKYANSNKASKLSEFNFTEVVNVFKASSSKDILEHSFPKLAYRVLLFG